MYRENGSSTADRKLTMIVTPQRPAGERATYKLMEAAQLIASHNPHTFTPDPRYPAHVQEREYERQPEEQRKVIMGAQQLNPAFLLADVPTATDGAPIVSDTVPAIVLGGNGRTMMLKRAYSAGEADPYILELGKRWTALGGDWRDVSELREPVLVRAVEGVSILAPSELPAAIRRYNEGFTQALNPRARAIAEARQLSPESVEALGELLTSGDATLRDVMRNEARAVVDILERDGIVTPQNRSAWVAGAELTDEARERVEGMFLGRVLGTTDRFAASSASLLAKVERMAAPLIRVAGANGELCELETVQAAIDVVNDAASHNLTVAESLAQCDMFGDAPSVPVARLATLIGSLGQRALGERMREWARHAAVDPRQCVMFGRPPTRQSARDVLFAGIDAPEIRQVLAENPASGSETPPAVVEASAVNPAFMPPARHLTLVPPPAMVPVTWGSVRDRGERTQPGVPAFIRKMRKSRRAA